MRIGLYPAVRGSDRPYKDSNTNLVMCPLPYDGGFMEAFYGAFFAVTAFLRADAKTPSKIVVPYAHDQHFCRLLEQNRDVPALEVISAMYQMGQPGLVTEGAIQTFEPEISAVAPVPGIIHGAGY